MSLLPSRVPIASLKAAGVTGMVVGHSPVGNVPALLELDGFRVAMADTSFANRLNLTAVVVGEKAGINMAAVAGEPTNGGSSLKVDSILDQF